MPRLFLIWWFIQPKVLGPGFASGNGRIEGTKIDVAPKFVGRLTQIFVNEGDFVKSGQIVAHMATTALLAQRDQVTTDLDQAENVIAVDESLVGARQADRTAADPVVDQHKADSMVAEQQGPHDRARKGRLDAAAAGKPDVPVESIRAARKGTSVVVATSSIDLGRAGDAARDLSANRSLQSYGDAKQQRLSEQVIRGNAYDRTSLVGFICDFSPLKFIVRRRLDQLAMGPENLGVAGEITWLRRVDMLKSTHGHDNANRAVNWVGAFDPHPKVKGSSLNPHVAFGHFQCSPNGLCLPGRHSPTQKEASRMETTSPIAPIGSENTHAFGENGRPAQKQRIL